MDLDDIIKDDWIIEYDENSGAWLVGVSDSSKRIPLEHGSRINSGVTAPPLHCAVCEKELKPVWPQLPHGNQADVLRFGFSGSYGEYVDLNFPVEGLWCKECTDKIFEAFPKLAQLIRDSL